MANIVSDENRKKAVKLITDTLSSSPNMDGKTLLQMESVMINSISQIEATADIMANPSDLLKTKNKFISLENLPNSAKVACQGVQGAYSNIAACTLFEEPDIEFYQFFEDVTNAVSTGEVEYGILPIENSSAGSVEEVVEFVCEYGCYINSLIQIKVEHCLAAAPGVKFKDIKRVYSHPQALMQTADFIKRNSFNKIATSNTAVAAKTIAEEQKNDQACLCSELSARIYGLEIIKKGVQDQNDNYTRFICISKDAVLLPGADIISVALSFPNQPGALGSLLTMFSIFNLDLTKIQSMPIGGADFNVRFHLDFTGNINDSRVENLLGHMYNIYSDFQFLGNFRKI